MQITLLGDARHYVQASNGGMRDLEIYSNDGPLKRSRFEDRAFVAIVGLLLVLGAATLILSFVSMSSSSAGSVPPQNGAPPVTMSDSAKAMASQFRSFTEAIPVLAFSGVDSAGTGDMLTPSEFAAQMQMLDDAGFTTVTDDQVRGLVMGESTKLPTKPILITFDGASPGLWANADPILASHGFSATVFLLGSEMASSDEGSTLNLDTLRAMKTSRRWSFGVHLDRELIERNGAAFDAWEQQVRSALAASRAAVESGLGVRVISMSYPASDITLPVPDNNTMNRLAELVGEQFELGFLDTSRSVVVTVDIDKAMAPRLPQARIALSPEALLGAIEEALPQRPPRAIDKITWSVTGDGSCIYDERTLVISADRTTSCQLQSTVQEMWDNVVLSGIVNGVSPTTAVTFRLRQRAFDQIEVALTATEVIVQRQVDGVWTQVSREPLTAEEGSGAQAVLVELRGSRVQVTLDGRMVVSADVGDSTGTGRVSLAAVVDEANAVTVTQLIVAATVGA